MRKCKFDRMDSGESTMDVRGQGSNCSDSVADISPVGTCLVGLPRKIQSNQSQLSIVVSGHGESLRMHIRPRWSLLDEWRQYR